MKKRTDLKHLIPWIERACDEDLFPNLLGWRNKKEKEFYVKWVHKSSENWDKSMSTVFEAWASDKKKLGGKDDRDLKAAFRNALRSKKNNLREVSRTRNERTWKIISDDSTESLISSNKITKSKQRKKQNKKSMSNIVSSTSSILLPSTSPSYSTNSYNNMRLNEGPLPSYQTLMHVSPPTPPKQTTDVYLETLALKQELHHLPPENMNLVSSSSSNDAYRVPSPTMLPASPTIPSFFDVFSEVDKNSPQTVNMVELFPNSHLEYPSQSTFREARIVPTSQQEWNTLNQIINLDQNQFLEENGLQQINQQSLICEEDFYDFSDIYTW